MFALAAGLCALAAPVRTLAAEACAAPPPLPPDLVAEARNPHPFPTFCSIPPVPTDVRTPAEYKAAVQDVKLAAAELASQVAPDRWSLSESEGFAAGARSQAAPPPPMTTGEDTEAFLRAMRQRATPPPRPR